MAQLRAAELGLSARPGRVRALVASPSCPYCSATAASLRKLDQTHRAAGLVVVGAYHHKDQTPFEPAKLAEYVRELGFEFPVAVDAGWATLKEWWLDGHDREYTSVSFLIDRRGIIRYVHAGGTIALDGREYAAISAQIRALLDERS